MSVIRLLETELQAYTTGTVPLFDGQKDYSQYKLVNRILLFANQVYPSGKTDSQGNYKYYFDVIIPRIDSEVKNIDFDTKDIMLYSDQKEDYTAVLLANAALKEWLKDHGQADELNEAVEESAGWGNVVWKKVKGGYERVDLKNFFVINQTARTLKDTPVIERHTLTQAELRAKRGVWENVDEVIRTCGNKFFQATENASETQQEIPTYEIYERNGEISVSDLKEANGKSPKEGDEEEYVLAKVVVAGLNKHSTEGKYILFCEEISKMPYKEHHRGRYNGRWFRKGLYETLFDIQVRANEIGNQIARGLQWASKKLFYSKDSVIAQNILTDLMDGDILKTDSLSSVDVRMEGIDQLIADWNRLMEMADKLANSYEVVTGESAPSGTPFRLQALMNQNANKLFDFLREKLGGPFTELIQDWILPDVLRDLRSKDILRLTGSSEYLKRFHQLAVDSWYLRNLPLLPPHDEQMAVGLKQEKFEEIAKKPEVMVDLIKGFFDDVKPRVRVTITGEQTRLATEMETLSSFIALEQDPLRRSALIEIAMAKNGIDIGNLPKMTPQMMASPQGQQEPVSAIGGEKTV